MASLLTLMSVWLFCAVLLTPVSSFLGHHNNYNYYYHGRQEKTRPSARRERSQLASSSSDQAVEALQSLTDFHEGRWKGVSVQSFTVTNDVAAGVVQRKHQHKKKSDDQDDGAPPYYYTTSVQYGLDVAQRDYTLTETMEWGANQVARRKLSLTQSRMDVDSVDASYSLDSGTTDEAGGAASWLPPAITGVSSTQQPSSCFAIEHCLALSDDARARCFVFYNNNKKKNGTDNAEQQQQQQQQGDNQQLARIVVCHEERMPEKDEPLLQQQGQNQQQLTARDLIEMQSDVDRLVERITGGGGASGDRNDTKIDSSPSYDGDGKAASTEKPMERLQAAMAAPSTNEGVTALTPNIMSLLELSSGVWLGDSVVRDVESTTKDANAKNRKGFGRSSAAPSSTSSTPSSSVSAAPFASWEVGVQKIAWQWRWKFGDDVRQITDIGRGMGAPIAPALAQNLAGSVCANESLSRKIPKEERLVYVDWEGDNVGFLLGSTAIQVPRYLKFERSRRVRPFYSEFSVFQAARTDESSGGNDESLSKLPELICSKMSRVYSFDGTLKQGVTSFFTLQRFDVDEEDIELSA